MNLYPGGPGTSHATCYATSWKGFQRSRFDHLKCHMLILLSTPIYVCLPTKIFSITYHGMKVTYHGIK